ncbi:hypothetical protein [Mesorhizobium sp. B2-4-1]|uniref:hypothetical protein n=1 Tax=Mesorhizobium sp. B2-4-1 TaxID=2589948 RepID=UPI00112DDC6A|nr:hypothetical protein [Mesorhizobium sp. B2-4-1]TPL66607.1 hypothetical protein FJ949_09580 [Mesorhizobium sp. B2-4-1]
MKTKDEISARRKAYRERTRERAAAYTKVYRDRHKERVNDQRRDHYANNKSSIREKGRERQRSRSIKQRFLDGVKALIYQQNRRQTDPNFKIAHRLRVRINRVLGDQYTNGSAVSDLGCSIPEFKAYIESKFLPGMSWENWAFDTWHLDHIKPLASFDLTDQAQFLQACHYTNMQPLWALDNMKKGAR